MTMADNETMTFPETAAAFGITPNTLRTWQRRGVIHAAKNKYGFWEFAPEEVERVKAIRNAALERAAANNRHKRANVL